MEPQNENNETSLPPTEQSTNNAPPLDPQLVTEPVAGLAQPTEPQPSTEQPINTVLPAEQPSVQPSPAQPPTPNQPAPVEEKTNTMAIVSLILSIFLALVGLILGIITYIKLKKTGERGKGLALASIIIGATQIVIGVIVAIVAITSVSNLVNNLNNDLAGYYKCGNLSAYNSLTDKWDESELTEILELGDDGSYAHYDDAQGVFGTYKITGVEAATGKPTSYTAEVTIDSVKGSDTVSSNGLVNYQIAKEGNTLAIASLLSGATAACRLEQLGEADIETEISVDNEKLVADLIKAYQDVNQSADGVEISDITRDDAPAPYQVVTAGMGPVEGIGGWAAMFYRDSSDGAWHYAFGAQEAPLCSFFSGEFQKIFAYFKCVPDYGGAPDYNAELITVEEWNTYINFYKNN